MHRPLSPTTLWITRRCASSTTASCAACPLARPGKGAPPPLQMHGSPEALALTKAVPLRLMAALAQRWGSEASEGHGSAIVVLRSPFHASL